MGINLYRKAVHVSFGIAILTFESIFSYHLIQKILLILVGVMFFFELWRLFHYESVPFKKLWVPLLKKDEFYRINDGWWYVVSLAIVSHLVSSFEFKLILLVFTFGDPIAALAGFYLGRHKIVKDKTLEGTLAFFLISLMVTFVWTKITLEILGLIIVMSLSEMMFKKDNFFSPLLGGLYFLIIFNLIK